MSEEQIRAWLLAYAWSEKTQEARERTVNCIMAQNDWRHLEVRTERTAGQAWEPGPDAVKEATAYELSGLYECHDGPHLETCPSLEWERKGI